MPIPTKTTCHFCKKYVDVTNGLFAMGRFHCSHCLKEKESKPTQLEDAFNAQKHYGHPLFYELLKQMADLHSRKNHDYSGTADPLKNLRSSLRLGIDPFLAVLIRLQDKWSRLESLAQADPLVKGESIEDTLMDNAVYSLLAIILLREKK